MQELLDRIGPGMRTSEWQSLKKQFKEKTGLDVGDAAHVMRQDAAFTFEEQEEADRRFKLVVQEDSIPRCNMVTYLTEEER